MLRLKLKKGGLTINLKISKVGSITKARKISDLCASQGILVSIQDTGGSGLVKAAIAHLAESTPPQPIRHSLWDCKDSIHLEIAKGFGEVINGKFYFRQL